MDKNTLAWILGTIGLIIIFGTHGFMVAQWFNGTAMAVGITHASLNIFAGIILLIAFLLKR